MDELNYISPSAPLDCCRRDLLAARDASKGVLSVGPPGLEGSVPSFTGVTAGQRNTVGRFGCLAGSPGWNRRCVVDLWLACSSLWLWWCQPFFAPGHSSWGNINSRHWCFVGLHECSCHCVVGISFVSPVRVFVCSSFLVVPGHERVTLTPRRPFLSHTRTDPTRTRSQHVHDPRNPLYSQTLHPNALLNHPHTSS